jgi:hypothetical protein
MSDSQLEHDHELTLFVTLTARLNFFLASVLQRSGRYEELVEKGKDAGYYARYDRSSGVMSTVIKLGSPLSVASQESMARRFEFACEKVTRLAAYPVHYTSRESRDPDSDKYGGAVRGDNDLHSFSGLPEDLDEVLSTLFAVFFGDMTLERARRLLGEEVYKNYIPIVGHALEYA